MLRYSFWVRGLVLAFTCFHWTFMGKLKDLRLEIGTLAQHSVFVHPYGKGKLRQVGALQSAQLQKGRCRCFSDHASLKWLAQEPVT